MIGPLTMTIFLFQVRFTVRVFGKIGKVLSLVNTVRRMPLIVHVVILSVSVPLIVVALVVIFRVDLSGSISKRTLITSSSSSLISVVAIVSVSLLVPRVNTVAIVVSRTRFFAM